MGLDRELKQSHFEILLVAGKFFSPRLGFERWVLKDGRIGACSSN